jgi:hypothetical protein
MKELLVVLFSIRFVSYKRRVCGSVCIFPAVARQEFGKHVPAATKNCWRRRFLCDLCRVLRHTTSNTNRVACPVLHEVHWGQHPFNYASELRGKSLTWSDKRSPALRRPCKNCSKAVRLYGFFERLYIFSFLKIHQSNDLTVTDQSYCS